MTGAAAFSGVLGYGSKNIIFTEAYLQSYSVSCSIGEILSISTNATIFGEFGTGSLGPVPADNFPSSVDIASYNSMEVSLDEFTTKNSFHRVLEDGSYIANSGLIKLKKDSKIKKVVMCSGKIYYDLLEARELVKNDCVVFVRIEQLYPFPLKTLANILKKYKKAKFIWCQEEPKNMGAWNSARNFIDRTLEIIHFSGDNVKYVGRKASSSTATGNLNKHLAQQKEILEKIVGK